MNRQIRRSVFETNSSSVHSLTMCSQNEYDRWLNGELIYDRWNDSLVEANPSDVKENEGGRYLTYDQFNDWQYIEYETFVRTHTTPSGDKVVAFGYYGHD